MSVKYLLINKQISSLKQQSLIIVSVSQESEFLSWDPVSHGPSQGCIQVAGQDYGHLKFPLGENSFPSSCNCFQALGPCWLLVRGSSSLPCVPLYRVAHDMAAIFSQNK